MPTQRLAPRSAHPLLAQGWVYLDVRTVEEFTACHPEGAWNIPAFFRGPMGMAPNPGFVAAVAKHFGMDAKLVVGCAAGGRSAKACAALEAAGWTNLVDVAGGFGGGMGTDGEPVEGWQACGLPCSTKPELERTWERLKS
jgi:rhodanese-related sulfurtransferase